MRAADEQAQLLRSAVAGGYRKHAARLVAPALVEQVLAHGHELYRGVTHIARVINEARGGGDKRKPLFP